MCIAQRNLNPGHTAVLARLQLLQYMIDPMLNKYYLAPLIGQVQMFISHLANHTGLSGGEQIRLYYLNLDFTGIASFSLPIIRTCFLVSPRNMTLLYCFFVFFLFP